MSESPLRAGEPLDEVDPLLAQLIGAEERRQQETIDLVASENFAPLAVRQAQGSILTNKYADGYPSRREYDGCEVVDEIERLATSRLRELFGAEHANVQPYSGSSANAAVLHALCAPGDPVLGFDFNQGGHPTHYAAETFAGRFYRGLSYGVREADYLIDLDEVRDIALRERPRLIFAGGSCYPRVVDIAAFRTIADEVGAYLVCDMAHVSGLVAGGVYPSPVPVADVCTLTVHKTLGGSRAGAILCREELSPSIDAAVFPGEQGGPLLHVIAGMAVTFLLASSNDFRDRMARTLAGARTLAAAFGAEGERSTISVVTGGTDVHLVLLNSGVSQDAWALLDRLHRIGVNANAMRIAFDPRDDPSCSGLRLGATSLATRGFGAVDFEMLATILIEALTGDESSLPALKSRIDELCSSFPIPS